MNYFLFTAIGLAVAFMLVIWNNKRNKEKLYNRKNRNFRANFNQRKNEKL